MEMMKTSKKRFDSIIPLSRQHHYALMLCLRIHRRTVVHQEDLAWLKGQTRKTILFFESDLVPHFQAEETVLFPAIERLDPSSDLLAELIGEHDEIRKRIQGLRDLSESGNQAALAEALLQFADLLEAHIRKEERRLFPSYEQNVSGEEDVVVGKRILEQIGTAKQPSHPEFLT